MTNENTSILGAYGEFLVGNFNLSDYRDKLLTRTGCFICTCTSGNAVISINFKDYVFCEGDIVIIFWGVIPVIIQRTEDFNMNWCILNAELAYDICSPLYIDFISYILIHPIYHVPSEEKTVLEKWWDLLFYIYEDMENSHRLLLVRNHVQNLLLKADENIKQILDKSEITSKRIMGLFSAFCKLLWEDHYREHRDVKFYADKLNISTCYLSRITRGTVRLSPKELINHIIVHELKMLLDTQDITINELANMFHFDDPSYMCRYFRRHTGMSLTEYKKK